VDQLGELVGGGGLLLRLRLLHLRLLEGHGEVVDDDLLAGVLVVEPEVGVGAEEEVDGGVLGKGVEGGLPEAGDDCALPLDGDNLRLGSLTTSHGRMVDLKTKNNSINVPLINLSKNYFSTKLSRYKIFQKHSSQF
jgi:hypothetical protein